MFYRRITPANLVQATDFIAAQGSESSSDGRTMVLAIAWRAISWILGIEKIGAGFVFFATQNWSGNFSTTAHRPGETSHRNSPTACRNREDVLMTLTVGCTNSIFTL